MRNKRLNRDAKVREEVYAIEDSALKDTQPLYNALTKGVTEKNYRKKLEANKKKFIAAYKPVAKKELGKVPGIFAKHYDAVVKNALDVSWDLAEQGAVEFLEWQSFSMSTLEGELVTQALLDGIDKGLQQALAEGQTFSEFLKGLRGTIGIDSINPYHLSNVWRTNLSTAHSANVYDRMQKGDFEAWEFVGIDDARQTDICNDRDGNIYPITNTKDFPPLHFQCRSEASPIDAIEMEEEGYKVNPVVKGVEPPPTGFKNLAITNYNNWVKDAAEKAGVESVLQSELNKITK